MNNNKIKVLHIIENLNRYGGTPNKLLLISKYLDKSKYEIFIVYFLDDDSLRNEFEKHGIHVIKINTGFFKSILDTYKIIKENGITIVSTHFNRSHIIGTFCAFFTGKILIQNEHGLPRGYKAKKNIIIKKLIYLFDKLTYRFKDAYIINSYTVMKEVQKDININTTKYFVVQNAIDVENKLLRNSTENKYLYYYKKNDYELVFGTVGGMTKGGWRDFITIVKAIKILVAEGYKVKLLIAGDGPDRETIETEIFYLGLEDIVFLLGYIDDVASFYKNIDVFIYPITISIGIGLVLLEPMFYEKPVISFAQGEEQERIIIDGTHGFNVELGNEKSLAKMMKHFINNPKDIDKFGENCKNLVVEKYNGKRIAADINRIYETLLLDE